MTQRPNYDRVKDLLLVGSPDPRVNDVLGIVDKLERHLGLEHARANMLHKALRSLAEAMDKRISHAPSESDRTLMREAVGALVFGLGAHSFEGKDPLLAYLRHDSEWEEETDND